MPDRVATVDEVKGIRHKKSYFLILSETIDNAFSKIDAIHFLTLDIRVRQDVIDRVDQYWAI